MPQVSPGAPPNGPRGRRPTAAALGGGAPPPNGRRVFSSLVPSRGVDRAELRASFKTHLL